MLIGIDFDNTIVCYDGLFHQVAVEQGLIPTDVPRSKGAVRDYLRRWDHEDEWTVLQGYVYGRRMREAPPFPGVLDFMIRCKQLGVRVRIISHKTLHPLLGPKYDLHAAAHDWLESHGFYHSHWTGLSPEYVYFDLTKQGKLLRIAAACCNWFIDDLPEFLSEPGFPAGVDRVLFDPSGHGIVGGRWQVAGSWAELEEIILCGKSPRV